MIEIKTTEMQNNFGIYFGKAIAGEAVAVSDGNRNAVLLSGDEYKKLEKTHRNAEYLAKLDRGIEDLRQGKGITVSMDELEKMSE
jgi:PHD/YefM family antitoxin component YafN of YafNO toxin-antitoxin module